MSAHVTDTAEAAAVISRDLGYDVRLSADEMTYHHDGLIGDVVAQSDILVDADLACTTDPTETFMVVQVHDGSYRIDPWGVERTYGRGSAFVLPPGQGIHIDVRRARITSTIVPARAVLDVVETAFDSAGGRLRSGAPEPARPAALQAWAAVATFYQRQILGRPELYRDDLLRAEATRTLITSAVSTFDLVDTAEPVAWEAAVVRRARNHIDDHLREPLTIQDVAHAARVGPRALHLAFQRQRGQSPMEYLRQGRLAGAHTDLLTADPDRGASVGAIAASWGFTNGGRFTAAYRAVYGENPGTTLRH